MDTITLGDVQITRVLEWAGPIGTASRMIPAVPASLWRENRSWLTPDFWEPATDAYLAHVQTWVLRSQGRIVLVDTGVGNMRDRPQVPEFAHLHTDFLDRLAATGVRPEQVDVVVNTHIHYDHVGWNTTRAGDEWVPTFPNATYLIPRADRVYFDPSNEARRPPPRDEGDRLRRTGSHLVFDDSIRPVLESGRALLWENTHTIDDNLALEAAPGHTPGSSVLRLRSGTDEAVFVGDMLHSPVQLLDPDANSCFCEDQAQSRATRRRVLGEAADRGALVLPAHLPGHSACEIRREGSRFTVHAWAAFSR